MMADSRLIMSMSRDWAISMNAMGASVSRQNFRRGFIIIISRMSSRIFPGCFVARRTRVFGNVGQGRDVGREGVGLDRRRALEGRGEVLNDE